MMRLSEKMNAMLSVFRKGVNVACMTALVFTAVCFMSALPNAEASMVMESGSYSGDVTSGTDILVPQFNSALGTLTGATFTLTGNFSSTWQVTNNDGPNTTLYWGQDGSISISYGSMTVSAAQSSPTPPAPYTSVMDWYNNSGSTPAQIRSFLNNSGSNLPSGVQSTGPAMTMNTSQTFTFASAADLAAFIGSGQIPFNLVADQSSLVLVSGGNYSDAGLNTAINGTVSVEYDYTAAPIPAAIWLFGSGLAGLAGLRRKFNS